VLKNLTLPVSAPAGCGGGLSVPSCPQRLSPSTSTTRLSTSPRTTWNAASRHFAGPVAMDTGRRQAICAPGRGAYRRDRRQLDAHPDPGGPCHHRLMQLPRSPTSPRSPRPVSDTTHLLLVPSRACLMSASCHQRRRPTARESALISLRLARLRDRSISLPTIYVRCRAYRLPGSAAVLGAPRVIGSRRCVTTTRCPR
jgi:hypothetical protein